MSHLKRFVGSRYSLYSRRKPGSPLRVFQRGGVEDSSTKVAMLTPGIKIGSYEVVSSLGAGGMGEVYRARLGETGNMREWQRLTVVNKRRTGMLMPLVPQ